MGHEDAGTWDSETQGPRDVGLGEAGTRGYDKQMTPEFFAEFVIYNFWWSYAGELASTPEADDC